MAPNAKCKLRQLKLDRVKDFILLEQEYLKNQEILKPKQEKEEVGGARWGRVKPGKAASRRSLPLPPLRRSAPSWRTSAGSRCRWERWRRSSTTTTRSSPCPTARKRESAADATLTLPLTATHGGPLTPPPRPASYVVIMSFVDRDMLEPGCTVLLHNKVGGVRGFRLAWRGPGLTTAAAPARRTTLWWACSRRRRTRRSL